MNLKYFKKEEFKCSCGKCNGNIEFRLGVMLDLARKFAGVSFKITSGFRCLEYNGLIGSNDTSSHIKGLAVDILVKDNNKKFLILSGLIRAGFTRIGIGESFIHVDIDENKPQGVIWKY